MCDGHLADLFRSIRRADGNLALVRRLLYPPGPSSSSFTVDPRNPDPSSLTSLSWAAIGGYEELFEYLVFDVGHDDDELSRDGDNNTILHLLASLPSPTLTPPGRKAAFASGELAVRLASIYYDRFAFVLDWSNTEGRTALHVAAQEGKDLFVNLLLDLGADIDLPDVFGNTPLHYASAWNHLPVCQTLIERGCRFRERNNDGFTAGDFAYSMSLQTALTTLARAQFDSKRLNKRTHTGLTSSSSASAPSEDYRAMLSSSATAVRGGRMDEEEEEDDEVGRAEESESDGAYGSGSGQSWGVGPPELGSVSPGRPEPPPPPTPSKPLPPMLDTALSALSIGSHPSPTRSATDQGQTFTLGGQPPSPAPSSPSAASSSRFHFHRPRHRPPLLTTAAIGPPTPTIPPPLISPLRLRSSSLSTSVSTAAPSSTISSARSRTSSNDGPPSGTYSASGDYGSGGSSGQRKPARDDKEGGSRREKWAGLVGRSKLVPPPNLAAKTSRWGK